MGIAALFFLALWLLVLALIGMAALACIPSVRVTVPNVVVFMVGGALAWAPAVLLVERVTLGLCPCSKPLSIAFLAVLIAALIGGGLGAVALKIKFANRSR